MKAKVKDVKPLRKDILVTDMEEGFRKTRNGVILPDDGTFEERNIKPRWCRVWKIGKDIDYVKPGQWILVKHGRWTYKTKVDLEGRDEPFYFQKIDPEAILLVSDEKPDYEIYVKFK